MSWQPLLTGALAASARDAIRAIADDIPRFAVASDASLSHGHAGLAVFHGYAEQAGVIDTGKMDEHLDQAISIMEGAVMAPTLFGGFVGVAWAVAHLEALSAGQARPAATDPGDSDDSEVDRALVRHVSTLSSRGSYDLLYGLIGIGIYALERRPRPLAEELVQQIVARLEELAEPTPAGLALPTWVDQLPEHARARFSVGNYNLGVAHGIPGVIGFLGSVPGERALALCAGLTAWLEAAGCPASDGSLYAPAIARQAPSQNTGCRAAWCYGDPGIAAALLRSARAAGEPGREALALAIARAAAARAIDSSGVVDASLCHGAAGLLHLFNRLHQATGEPAFAQAAIRWAERTLAMRGEGVGGFHYRTGEDGGHALRDAGFLNGAAGIGLALLAAVSDLEPRWDVALLCDIPPV